MVAFSHQSAMARRAALIDYGKFFLLAGLAVWLLALGTHGFGYHWQWYRVPRFLFTTESGVWTAGPLLLGLLVTLEISALALICTLILGLTAALYRLSASFTARTLARGYLELMSATYLTFEVWITITHILQSEFMQSEFN